MRGPPVGRDSCSEPALSDLRCADFDGALFHLSAESKTVLLLSIAWKCWPELQAAGAEEILNTVYNGYVTNTEPGYNFTVRIDLEALPPTPQERGTSGQRLVGSSMKSRRGC